jgi:heme/copper-type cytochrome/quinol oxidase subunit 4
MDIPFPQPTQVNVRCPRNNKEGETRTEILYNAGIIYNATSCFIMSSKVRTLPELHRVMHTVLDNPSIYMPDQSPELTASEVPHIKAALPASITEIDNIKSRVDAPRQSLDVDTLLHVRHVSLQQDKQTHWHLNMTIISCTVTFLLIIFFPFILNYTTLCYDVPVKIPLPNLRIQLHLHLQTFLHRNTQINNGNGCTQRKRYIHWLSNASGELIQAVTSYAHSISRQSPATVPRQRRADT